MSVSKKTNVIVSKDPSSLRNQSSMGSNSSVRPCNTRPADRDPVSDFRKIFNQTALTNKYYLAGAARTKLEWEAGEGDLNLLRLVGHANFLDRLQDEIDDAERLHETRHQARLVSNKISPKKSSIIWADTSQAENDGDEEQTSSDSDGEDDILELVRTPTRYQLPKTTQGQSPAPRQTLDEDSFRRQVKAIELRTLLPRIAEEDEEGVEDVTNLLQAMDQEVVAVAA